MVQASLLQHLREVIDRGLLHVNPPRVPRAERLVGSLVDGFPRVEAQQDVDRLGQDVCQIAEVARPIGDLQQLVDPLDYVTC